MGRGTARWWHRSPPTLPPRRPGCSPPVQLQGRHRGWNSAAPPQAPAPAPPAPLKLAAEGGLTRRNWRRAAPWRALGCPGRDSCAEADTAAIAGPTAAVGGALLRVCVQCSHKAAMLLRETLAHPSILRTQATHAAHAAGLHSCSAYRMLPGTPTLQFVPSRLSNRFEGSAYRKA